MKMVHRLIEGINEELEGAREYAEKYLHNKAMGNTARASAYRQMAMDELGHASHAHSFALQDIEALKKVHPLTEECEAAWEKAKSHYAECVAKVKYMLN